MMSRTACSKKPLQCGSNDPMIFEVYVLSSFAVAPFTLIFPQGTRVRCGERVPFKKGIGRIYDSLNLPCIPVALNSGMIWPKNSFMKYNGNIHISFLEPIMPGKDKTDFIKEIEYKIYSEIEKYS